MVNVAVVGCGRWGQNYVRNFSEISQARLLICCDADVQRLKLMKNRYPRVHTTRSLSEVVNDQRINAVVIATPRALTLLSPVSASKPGSMFSLRSRSLSPHTKP